MGRHDVASWHSAASREFPASVDRGRGGRGGLHLVMAGVPRVVQPDAQLSELEVVGSGREIVTYAEVLISTERRSMSRAIWLPRIHAERRGSGVVENMDKAVM